VKAEHQIIQYQQSGNKQGQIAVELTVLSSIGLHIHESDESLFEKIIVSDKKGFSSFLNVLSSSTPRRNTGFRGRSQSRTL
jgi:hypothetical protein